MKLFMNNSHRQVKNGIKVKISIKYTNLKTIKKLLLKHTLGNLNYVTPLLKSVNMSLFN